MEEKSWRRNHGGGIMEEESWRRNHGGVIMEKESWMRKHGGCVMRLMLFSACEPRTLIICISKLVAQKLGVKFAVGFHS